MKFGCAASQQFDVFEIRPNQFTRDRRNRRLMQSLDERNGLPRLFQLLCRPSNGTRKKLAQRIESVPPRVAFIRYELLKNADRGLFSGLLSILNRSLDRWSMRKANLFGQKVSQLQIGI